MATTKSAKGWERPYIRAEIEVKFGGTLSDFAKAKGLNRLTLYSSFTQRTPTCNRVVAEFLGVSVHSLWPHWYHPNGDVIAGVNSKSTRNQMKRTKAAAA